MAAKEKEDAKVQPLMIFYDSEAANGNVYCGDIIEIAAKCHPDVVKGSFQSLINTKQPLCAFAARDCGLSQEDLSNKPFFKEIFLKFLSWIDDMVKLAKKKHGKHFFPVLCAHHGYQFDFLILLNNMERCGLHHSILTQHNVHFADTLVFCHELKDNGEKLLANTRLSLEALYRKFFPKKIFKDRHRAMGDVDGMVKIFTQTPLRKLLRLLKYSSTKERLEYYISQCGKKQQQAILEGWSDGYALLSEWYGFRCLDLGVGGVEGALNYEKYNRCTWTSEGGDLTSGYTEYTSFVFVAYTLSNCIYLAVIELISKPSLFLTNLDKLCKLDACSKNMSIKKLLKEGITYNTLKRIFEDCCSFMDFYEVMKTYGIERKVSKVIALHFGGLGLQNHGLTAYPRLHEEKPNQASSESHHAESKPQPNMVSVNSLEDGKLSERENGTEDWERDLVKAAPRSSFTLKCTTPAPLSLVLDDLSYTHSEKNKIGVESPIGKVKSERTHSSHKSEGEHSLSEMQNVEVGSKSSRGKTSGAEARKGSTDSAPHAPKQRDEKTVKGRKSFRKKKPDGMLSKEVAFSGKDNRRDLVKPRQSKLINPSVNDNYITKNKPSAPCSSSDKGKPESELKEQAFDGCCSPTECSVAKLQLTEISGASSTTNLEHKFASVLIGDIAILVPVECDGKDCDSNVTGVNEPEAHTLGKSKELSSTQESPVFDNVPSVHAVQGPFETHFEDLTEGDNFDPNKITKSSQQNCDLPPGNSVKPVVLNFPSEHDRSLPKSPESSHETCFEEQPEVNESNLSGAIEVQFESCEESTLKSSFLAFAVRSDGDTCHAHPSSLDFEQSPGNALVHDQITCEEEKENVSNYLHEVRTSTNYFVPLVNLSSSGFQALKETDQGNSKCIFDTNSYFMHEACSANKPPCLNGSTVERTNGLISSWEEISCAHLPNSALPPCSPVENPSLGSCGMNQGFASDLTSTESTIQARGDFLAELSSESSSASDDQSVDDRAFSRQPPLGEERRYTPDTVHQQSNQLPLAGNAREVITQQPSGPCLYYSQASFPPLQGNPHRTFYQGYPALPLLKPCYPSFTFSTPVQPVMAPHLMQPPHPQQVFMPPFQYRNQMMFSNLVPPSLGLPSVPHAQLQPQLFPVFQAATAFPCFSGVNLYEQAQQAAGPPVDASGQLVFTHSATALSQGGSVVSDSMDSCGSQGSLVDSSSDTSSVDSSFEGMITSPVNQTDNNLKYFLAKADNDFGYTTTVAYKDTQKEPKEDFKENNPLSGHKHESQVVTLAKLCHMKVSGSDISSSHQYCESQEDLVHKQVTILSHEESVMGMGRRLSPDGSSVEGVCLDLSSNDFKDEFSKEASGSPSDWDNLSKECCSYTQTVMKELKNGNIKDSGPSPKPQRIKGKCSRRWKSTQSSSFSTSSHDDLFPGTEQLSVTCLTVNEQSSICENNNNSFKLEDGDISCVNDTGQRLKTRKNHRRVRFSKRDSARCRESFSSLQQPSKRQENHSIGRTAREVWKRGLTDKLKGPFKEKSSRKGTLEEKVPKLGTKIDKNNNS